MKVRVAVPTVLEATARDATPRPYVQVALDEDAWQLSRGEAMRYADWMRAAHALLGAESARLLAGALDEAVAALEARPPRVLERVTLGLVQGEGSDGEPVWIEVALEPAVLEASNPRIVLDVAESPVAFGAGDTWWAMDDEAYALAALLRLAAASERVTEIGRLEEKGPNRRPWLHVCVASEPVPDPGHERPPGVQLRFDDDLLAERGEDGIVWMSAEDAHRLAGLLDAALEAEKRRPPHVYEPPEPGTREIARFTA